jgi:hypothetical protein
MEEPSEIPGYVRCGVVHTDVGWRFELLDEAYKVAIVSIDTAEGSIDFGLNRVAATNLLETLQLFLSDWPTGSQAS